MFGVLYEAENGKVFKVCETLESAQKLGADTACMGYEVTVFDYDKEAKTYLEFYKI